MGLVAGFVACEKDKEFELTKLSVENETITPSYESAEVNCRLKADATISEAYVHYSLSSSFAKYEVAKMSEEKGVYVAQLTNLQDNTIYYIRYSVSNKYSSAVTTEVKAFTTKAKPTIVLPSVSTAEITQITNNSAVAGGNVTSDGNASVTERGVCIATVSNPTTSNTKVTAGSGTGSFTCNLTGLQANTTYYVRAYAVNSKGTAYGEQVSFTTSEQSSTPNDGTENSHEYVDLGLSVKWATCNVGANAPEEYGDYFAWGEVEPKTTYNWSTYKWCNGSYDTQTKYCTNSSYGTVDNKIVLEAEDDAAAVNWGGAWRMPTKAEQDELRNNCIWIWTIQNGVNGYKVTGPNGNSIFLPAAGYRGGSSLSSAGSDGNYWSSSLDTDDPYYGAYCLYFNSGYVVWYDYSRCRGHSVRPVLGENEDMETTVPTVITSTVTQITETSAVAGGNVISDGNASVTERGVVYSTVSNPVINNIYHTTITSGSGTGSFSVNLTNLVEGTTYHVRAYAVNSAGVNYGEEVSFTTNEQSSTPNDGAENGHAYVDLGLSVKWATCNVGAKYPDEYGDYFAWGEVEPKTEYNWSTYKWCNGSYDTQTKYCTNSSYGTVDNKTVLDAEDDAAAVNWGGAWRMPTKAEQDELRNNCTWTLTTQNGVNGYKVTSKSNGNSIFLPAAGYRYVSSLLYAGSNGYYWSSSLYTGGPNDACGLGFSSDGVGWGSGGRYDGQSVRPVCQ